MKKVAFATLAVALLSTHASALTSTSDLSSDWPSQSKMQREDRLSLGQEKPVMFNGKRCMYTTIRDRYVRCELTDIVALPSCPRKLASELTGIVPDRKKGQIDTIVCLIRIDQAKK